MNQKTCKQLRRSAGGVRWIYQGNKARWNRTPRNKRNRFRKLL